MDNFLQEVFVLRRKPNEIYLIRWSFATRNDQSHFCASFLFDMQTNSPSENGKCKQDRTIKLKSTSITRLRSIKPKQQLSYKVIFSINCHQMVRKLFAITHVMFRKRQPFHDHLFLNGQSPLGIKSPANKSNEMYD